MVAVMSADRKAWLVIGAFMAWMALAATLDSSYSRQYLACDLAYQRTLNQDALELCLNEAGLTRNGQPKNSLARLILLR